VHNKGFVMRDDSIASKNSKQQKRPGDTPKELAYEYSIDERLVRLLLRHRFPRDNRKSWKLDKAQARTIRACLNAITGGKR